MHYHFLLQRIFPTQGSNPRLLHLQADSLPLNHQRKAVKHSCYWSWFEGYPHHIWGFPSGAWVKNPPAMQEMWVWPLGQEAPLEKGMATHSSILAWWSQRTEEPGGLQSMESQRVRYDWSGWARTQYAQHIWPVTWPPTSSIIHTLSSH